MSNLYMTMAREPFFELARPYINQSSSVLDIGAGDGAFAKHFERNDFYLFDGNPISVDTLKKDYPNTVLGRLPNLPFEGAFFDVIHCSHVIEHLHPNEFYETLKEIDRCLSTGGTLIISAPLLWEGFYDDLSHVKPYSPSVIERYLSHGDSSNATSEIISDRYKTQKKVYRTYRQPLSQAIELGSITTLNKVVRKVLHMLKATVIVKNGYTIVLSKG